MGALEREAEQWAVDAHHRIVQVGKDHLVPTSLEASWFDLLSSWNPLSEWVVKVCFSHQVLLDSRPFLCLTGGFKCCVYTKAYCSFHSLAEKVNTICLENIENKALFSVCIWWLPAEHPLCPRGCWLAQWCDFSVLVPQSKMWLFLELCWEALNSDCSRIAFMYPNSWCAAKGLWNKGKYKAKTVGFFLFGFFGCVLFVCCLCSFSIILPYL